MCMFLCPDRHDVLYLSLVIQKKRRQSETNYTLLAVSLLTRS